MKNETLDRTLGENTIIEGFNLDETFEHQIMNLKLDMNPEIKLNAF